MSRDSCSRSIKITIWFWQFYRKAGSPAICTVIIIENSWSSASTKCSSKIYRPLELKAEVLKRTWRPCRISCAILLTFFSCEILQGPFILRPKDRILSSGVLAINLKWYGISPALDSIFSTWTVFSVFRSRIFYISPGSYLLCNRITDDRKLFFGIENETCFKFDRKNSFYENPKIYSTILELHSCHLKIASMSFLWIFKNYITSSSQ